MLIIYKEKNPSGKSQWNTKIFHKHAISKSFYDFGEKHWKLGDDPCKHRFLQLSWQNYHNDIDNLFKTLMNNAY